MLNYVSANLGLTPSDLTPLMEKTHNQGLVWYVVLDYPGTTIIGHGGGTAGYSSFIGFDKARRRGVAVLSNRKAYIDVKAIGVLLLVSEWPSDRRPRETHISGQEYGSFGGQYRRLPEVAPGLLKLWRFILHVPKTALYISAGVCLAALWGLLRCAGNSRRRWIILGCAIAVGGLSTALMVRVSGREADARSQPGIGIRPEENRLFVQVTGSRSGPFGLFLPPNPGELLPESKNRFFERLSGMLLVFSRDIRGK